MRGGVSGMSCRAAHIILSIPFILSKDGGRWAGGRQRHRVISKKRQFVRTSSG